MWSKGAISLLNDPEVIRWAATPFKDEAKQTPKVVAVVGLSSNPERPSFQVARELQRLGYRIIPVNPKETEVLGVKAVPDLKSLPEPVDIIDVFRAGKHAPEAARQAAEANTGARVFWMQEGVISQEAAEIAEAAGLEVVMDRCLYVEALFAQ